MQTMPAKTRTAVAIGAVLLAMAAGIFALRMGDRGAAPAPSENQSAVMPPAATPFEPDPALTDSAATDPMAGDWADPLSDPAPAASADPLTQDPVMADEVPAFHVVKSGDSLFEISRYYYGDHIYAGDIERLNNLSNPNHLLVGQELQLPSRGSLAGSDQ